MVTNLIAIILAIIFWNIIYLLFTTKSKLTIATIALVIVFFSLSFIYQVAAGLNKTFFQMREDGEIQIAYSPMLVPKSKNADDYCNQFTDQDGNPLNIISVRDDGTYCGSYFNFYKDKYLMLPYKILKDGKAEYWVSPECRIIGPQPKINMSLKAIHSIK